jgi:squalene synthase HpnC
MGTAAHYKGSRLAEASHGIAVTGRSWTTASAYQYCEELARSHYENFPVGSLLVPSRLRKHFYAIYAFARTGDDFADEGYLERHTEQERLALLAEWREMLVRCGEGEATHPIFVALRDSIDKFNLPIQLFEDLLSAFVQDVTVRRYPDFANLLDYCRRSANPIGRLILNLFGYRDEQQYLLSDDICTALQLTNHWQDIAVDLEKDRVYLPEDDMARFNVSIDDLRQSEARNNLRELIAFETARARELFRRGKPLCLQTNGRLGVELRTIWLGGWRILERIEKNRYDVLAGRPVISFADKAGILLSALRKGRFRRSNG